MANSTFGLGAVWLVSLLACACGGSSSDNGSGAGGTHSAVPGKAGAGSANGSAGSDSNGVSGSSNSSHGGAGHGGAGSSGASHGGTGSSGASHGGTGSSGANHSAGSAGAANPVSNCPVAAPCGGNVVGDWTIQQECVSLQMNPLAAVCADATLTIHDIKATGTVSFKADNTMTSSGAVSFVETVAVPASCIDQEQCALLEGNFTVSPGFTSAKCDYDTATGCLCNVNLSQTVMNSGTYEVQGNNLITTSAAASQPGTASFCVSGDTLSIYQTDPNGLGSTLILTK